MSGPKQPRRKPVGRGGGRNRRPGPGRSGVGRSNLTTSPLQLPHVKVTIRNISGSQHDSMEGVIASIREFVNSAFADVTGQMESAYTLACQQEKDSFDSSKSLLESTVNSNGSTASLGWVYEITPSTFELPSAEAIVNSAERSALDGNTKERTIHSTIDSAMSQMMNECGKVYLNYVGGKVVFDEESAINVALSERIAEEKKKMEKHAEIDTDKGNEDDNAVEGITQSMSKLSTESRPAETAPSPMTRIRILSVTPVKKSKRRGDIGARAELVLYPPDPCLIFKEQCREAGRIAAERYFDATEDTENNDKEIKAAAPESENEKDTISGVSESAKTAQQTPTTIPNFPRLSPAERSRAIARSRVLMDRIISAMKVHVKSKSNDYQGWGIHESSSQKTWKSQSYDIVPALMTGASLSDLLAAEESKSEGDKKARRSNARGNRYDSTIESSEDYKLFMEMYTNGRSAPICEKAKGDKPKDEKLDEEGRPLSAIVQHLQSKREEEARVKAEAAAAASRARAKASAEAAREKARKRELEVKTRKAKARMKRDEEKKKKKASGKTGSSVGSGTTPPAVLLKKGSVSTR